MIMRYFIGYVYNGLFYCLLPYLLIRLRWRARQATGYPLRLAEFRGVYSAGLPHCLWIHAVSIGEIIAATPLIHQLLLDYAPFPILVTTTTATGAKQVYATFGHHVRHAYLPLDLPHMMTRFFNTMHPIIALLMETELWPNLLIQCYQRNIPVCLLNARLSAQSARRYQYIASFMRLLLAPFSLIAAQSSEDAARFLALGASPSHLITTGNIKFDLEIPAHLSQHSFRLRQTLGQKRFIWIAASTHPGEENIILEAHDRLRQHNPQALLILVPRHPERFYTVKALCKKHSLITVLHSHPTDYTENTAVYLGDILGELLLLYSTADVAFIGGSLVPHGGHNLIEPAACHKPLLTGPYLFNFEKISQLFLSAQALIIVHDVETLLENLVYLMRHADERLKIGQRAQQMIQSQRGSLQKQLRAIHPLLKKKGIHSLIH